MFNDAVAIIIFFIDFFLQSYEIIFGKENINIKKSGIADEVSPKDDTSYHNKIIHLSAKARR